jgi:hypothetical protein
MQSATSTTSGLAAPPPRFYQRVVGTLRRRIRIDEWSDQVQPRLVRGVLQSEREWCRITICPYPGRGYAKSGRKLSKSAPWPTFQAGHRLPWPISYAREEGADATCSRGARRLSSARNGHLGGSLAQTVRFGL